MRQLISTNNFGYNVLFIPFFEINNPPKINNLMKEDIEFNDNLWNIITTCLDNNLYIGLGLAPKNGKGEEFHGITIVGHSNKSIRGSDGKKMRARRRLIIKNSWRDSTNVIPFSLEDFMNTESHDLYIYYYMYIVIPHGSIPLFDDHNIVKEITEDQIDVIQPLITRYFDRGYPTYKKEISSLPSIKRTYPVYYSEPFQGHEVRRGGKRKNHKSKRNKN